MTCPNQHTSPHGFRTFHALKLSSAIVLCGLSEKLLSSGIFPVPCISRKRLNVLLHEIRKEYSSSTAWEDLMEVLSLQFLLPAAWTEGRRTHRMADSGQTAGCLHSIQTYMMCSNISNIYLTFSNISNIYNSVKHFRFTSGWGWFDTKSVILGEFLASFPPPNMSKL